MTKPSIGLISDLPWSEGIGRYGVHLQRLLDRAFEIKLIYFNYQERRLEVTSNRETRTVAGTARLPVIDNKPWFWQRLRRTIPQCDLMHIISQNLSFLVPRDGNALVTCHDIAPLFVPGKPWVKWARRWLYSGLPRARAVMADSRATATDLIQTYRMPADRIRVIPLGVDRSLFRPMDKEECRRRLGLPLASRVVLNVGIDKWRKNIAGLVRAMGLLIARIPEVLLIRIGRPSKKTRELIRVLGLDRNVKHVGSCSDEDLNHFYNAADVFVFPSFYEGFGLPPLEAMACGTPVVSSNRTSLPEVVGEAGILIDPEDVSALAKRIEQVLADRRLARELSERGLAHVAQFSWENTANATAEVYRSVLSG